MGGWSAASACWFWPRGDIAARTVHLGFVGVGGGHRQSQSYQGRLTRIPSRATRFKTGALKAASCLGGGSKPPFVRGDEHGAPGLSRESGGGTSSSGRKALPPRAIGASL